MMMQPRNKRLPLRQAVVKYRRDHAHVDLIDLLREKSGADRVEIDTTGMEPTFGFAWADGCRLGGPPWAILAEMVVAPLCFAGDRTHSQPPANIRPATAREQAVSAARCQAVRAATGLVWRQLMVRQFDRAVMAGAVLLYARPGSVTADFMHVPADVWPALDVVDWESGTAVAPDGTAYFSNYAHRFYRGVQRSSQGEGAEAGLVHSPAHSPVCGACRGRSSAGLSHLAQRTIEA
jgi:hypothetical protein